MIRMGLRKTLVGVIAMGIIVATAVPLQAQMKPDPRLAEMRAVWIEAEDDLSDAPGVATCFAKEVNQTLPLTSVGDKNYSDGILRFRAIDNRIELSVVLDDNQQLWSGTAIVPTSDTIKLSSRRCVAARELIEHLRSAMQSSRDGTWYQQPRDRALEPLMSVSASLEPLATQFDIVSSSDQIVERNQVYWRFSWKMTVRNYGPEAVLMRATYEFQNRDGFIVNNDMSPMKLIRPQETLELTGTKLVNADVAPSVTNGVGRALLVPSMIETTDSSPR